MSRGSDVVIVGGGVIGLSIAYALARQGLAPTVLDAARSAGVRVVFTRHMSLPNELSGAAALRTGRYDRRLCRRMPRSM